MKKNEIYLGLIVLAAFLLVVYGAGSFFREPGDEYYDYIATYTSTVQAGQPISYTVRLSGGNWLKDCDKNGMGPRISPDTAHYCDSFTYFNARSFRVRIDGTEVANLYNYPSAVVGASISTSLPDIGPVCCYAACGPCSVCSDQEANGQQNERAYLFGVNVPPQTAIDGQELFTLTIPNSLPPGNHTVEIQYFAETANYKKDNTCANAYSARLAGQQSGDQNNRYDYYDSFVVEIPGVSTPAPAQTETTTENVSGSEPTIPPANQTVIRYQCCDGTIQELASSCPASCTSPPVIITQNVPAQDNTAALVVIAVAALAIWKAWGKR